jgi:hypothetical protein
VFIVVVYFVIDSVRKLLDTYSYLRTLVTGITLLRSKLMFSSCRHTIRAAKESNAHMVLICRFTAMNTDDGIHISVEDLL